MPIGANIEGRVVVIIVVRSVVRAAASPG